MGGKMIDTGQKWNVERDGKRMLIRNENRRIIAALSYVTGDDVAECDLVEMIAIAPLAFGVCMEFLRVWRDGSKQREKLDQIARFAEVVESRGETMITGSDIQRVGTLEKNLDRAKENVKRLNEKVAGLQAMARTLEKHGPLAERWRMVVDLWLGMKSPGEFVEHVEDYAAAHNIPLADAVRAIHKAWEQCGRPGEGTESKQMEIEANGNP